MGAMEATGEPSAGARELPEGTVTFLFTDLEGSTTLLEAHPAAYRDAVRRHHNLLRGAVEAHGGVVFETVGDAVYAAFARPTDAVAAALAGQLALQTEAWPDSVAIRARMGLHTGEVERQGRHYFGAPLYRCARLTAAAHGGQVVLSEAAAALVREALPDETSLRDLGDHRLKDLSRPERIFELLHPRLAGDRRPLRTLDALPHNLPLQLTSFVGRERELADIAALVATQRLVTLTGPGGTGKTRLALQAAADTLEAYPDGVWLAELGALAEPTLVPAAVAAAVGVREEPGRPLLGTLTAALRPKCLLLMLDNCEHLLEGCARLADALLRACPRLTILATSREALGIAGETGWRVPSLALPDAAQPPPVAALTQYEAVRLFVDRALADDPAFRVTSHNASAVAEVCHRLDGIPLALELAAARLRVLPVEQLLARLEDRFRLLTGGSRTALPRQQTLRATVDWSYALLSDPEKTCFNRLAVFAGGFTLEAAEAVCADAAAVEPAAVLDLLTHLIDKSLVSAGRLPDGTGRCRLLETLRHYARQTLAASGEAAAVHERHARHFLAYVEQAEPALRGPAQLDWLDWLDWLERLEREHDNLRAALDWFAEHGPAEDGLRLAAALGSRASFWVTRGYLAEGRQRLARRWLSGRRANCPVRAPPRVLSDPRRGPASAGSRRRGCRRRTCRPSSPPRRPSGTTYCCGCCGRRAPASRRCWRCGRRTSAATASCSPTARTRTGRRRRCSSRPDRPTCWAPSSCGRASAGSLTTHRSLSHASTRPTGACAPSAASRRGRSCEPPRNAPTCGSWRCASRSTAR